MAHALRRLALAAAVLVLGCGQHPFSGAAADLGTHCGADKECKDIDDALSCSTVMSRTGRPQCTASCASDRDCIEHVGNGSFCHQAHCVRTCNSTPECPSGAVCGRESARDRLFCAQSL